MSWVNKNAHRGHGPGRLADFLSNANFPDLLDNTDKSKVSRMKVFSRIRKPHSIATKTEQESQASLYYMPQLSGDGGDAVEGKPNTWLTLLEDSV